MRYGKGSGLPVLLDNLMCEGEEDTLLDCARNQLLENNCDPQHSEDAGVVCNGKELIQERAFLVPN